MQIGNDYNDAGETGDIAIAPAAGGIMLDPNRMPTLTLATRGDRRGQPRPGRPPPTITVRSLALIVYTGIGFADDIDVRVRQLAPSNVLPGGTAIPNSATLASEPPQITAVDNIPGVQNQQVPAGKLSQDVRAGPLEIIGLPMAYDDVLVTTHGSSGDITLQPAEVVTVRGAD